MKLTIESTTRVVQLRLEPEGLEIPARVWEGKTESGIPVICLVTCVAVDQDHDLSEFERELEACKPPRAAASEAFPLRLIL